jgi:isovaleryl-CoA dehydrogenase
MHVIQHGRAHVLTLAQVRHASALLIPGLPLPPPHARHRYAKERSSFGKPIATYGQIQRYIAESYADYMAGRAYTYSVAGRLDLSAAGAGLDTDGVKLYASVMGKNVADRAMQVLGGNGYVGEYGVERLWRDAKLIEIGGGTLEAHHKNMARDLRRLHALP